MKKRNKLMILVILILVVISAFIFFEQNLTASEDGHWIYNEHGEHVGCVSPGEDCTWGKRI